MLEITKIISPVNLMEEVEHYLQLLSINTFPNVVTLFDWGKGQSFCSKENPASGLKVKSSRRADEKRSAFTAGDLKVIFSDDYTFLKHKRPDRFFIPLILLHTGARVGEVAQLGVNDVKKEDGVWCFDVHPSD